MKLSILLSGILAATSLFAAEYSGSVNITEKGKEASAQEYADAVIYFVPDNEVETRSS